MRILCIGDIVGSIGVAAFGKKIPELRQKYSPDIIIVNGENAGDGCSITAPNCGALFMFGADVITGGNHSLYSRDMTEIYEREDGALRPANLHPNAPGSGGASIQPVAVRTWRPPLPSWASSVSRP